MEIKLRLKNFKQISVHTYGKGEPVLCLSGFASSHHLFDPLVKRMKDQYQMILIDNRGMGLSDDADTEYEMADLALDCIEIANELSLDRFHVIGISMGGFIAQELALRSNNLLSLSLLCTTSGGPSFLPLNALSEKAIHHFYNLEEPLRSRKALDATLHPSFKLRKPAVYEDIIRLRTEATVRVDQVVFQKRAVDNFLRSSLPLERISTPTFILSGEQDRYVNSNNSVILSQRIPNSRLALIEKSDHLFFIEESEKVSNLLSRFFKEVSPVNFQQEVIA